MNTGPQFQPELFESFSTTKPGNPLFCHQEFLEKIQDNRGNAVGKRAALLLHRLLVDERRQHYKSTRGTNRGWRRSRLGGRGGNHFYAWWAPKGAPPLKGLKEFSQAPAHSIFLRDIRHHDDHSELTPQSLDQQYLPITVKDLRREEYAPAPWTPNQARFSGARQRVRVLKGHPGSGKTTALWHAADSAGKQSILYVTYSVELAALARDHFDKFCTSYKKFHVVTFSRFLREVLDSDAMVESERESRARFLKELGGLPPRVLGPWADNRVALYDEMHAHFVGSALPVAIGRFPACNTPRLPDKSYRERREWAIGRPAVDALLDVANTLRKRGNGNFEEKFFPELCLAWKAACEIGRGSAEALAQRGLLGFDCIAVDEAQDLTPIESLALIILAAAIERRQKAHLSMLIAGDEAQTVRPTDFEWGWFQDLLHHCLGSPTEFQLSENVRSPRRIAELVNRVWDLYSHISKQDRPSGTGRAEIDEDASDQVLYCSAAPGPELDQLLAALTEREGLAIICLDERVPEYIPEALRPRILTVSEAKGLDFHSVCVLDPGKHLERIIRSSDRVRRDSDIEPLSKRLAIDQLRVSISRPTERLYWLDVSPSDRVVRNSLAFLNGTSTGIEVSPAVPAVILKTLEEELLEAEERVRLCQSDAMQYLAVKPEMAWARAKQAVALLGRAGSKDAIADETVHRSAHLTLAQVSFCLAFRRLPLAAELGRPDFFGEAVQHAHEAGRRGLAAVLRAIAELERSETERKLNQLALLAESLVRDEQEVEPWLSAEIAPRSTAWLEALEKAVGMVQLAGYLVKLLPSLYRVFGVLDADRRIRMIQQRAIDVLMAAGKHKEALEVIAQLPEPQPKLEAQCQEGMGEYRAAAECYRKAGSLKDALRNYRAIPDLEQALALISEIPDHPAAESLQWIKKMQKLVAQRPDDFTRVVSPAEKKLLEELLEGSLGVSRKKKAAVKRAPAGRKPGRPRKAVKSDE